MTPNDQALAALAEFPAALREDYERALPFMRDNVDSEQLGRWFEAGIEMAGQSAHAWDAAAQYFRASPAVVASMPANYFMSWVECGLALAIESPTLGGSYFTAGPKTMAILRSRHIEAWTELGRGLYKGTWKSSTLANRFFESSPDLLGQLSFEQLERFVGFLDILSRHSYDLAVECLALGQKLFPIVGEDKDAFISLSLTLVETGWRQVKAFYEASAKALPRIERTQRLRFLEMANRLLVGGATNMPSTMLEISQAMHDLDRKCHSTVLDMAEPVLEIMPSAMPEFVKSAPVVLNRLSLDQLATWCEEGKRVLHKNKDGGLAFFKIESSHSEEFLEGISSGVEFGRIQTVVEMYCRALAGEKVDLADTQELVDKNIGWVSTDSPTTEGSTVYLPSLVDKYPTKDDNFLWFKVVSTHQVARMEFGSFRFEFDVPATRFDDLRIQLESDRSGSASAKAADLQRFFDLFDERQLALDVFSVVEDGRVDALVKDEYKGIRRPYERVQADSLETRSDIKELPAREALVEFLVRTSLSRSVSVPVPSEHKDVAKEISRIARHAMMPAASVEDSAEATLRIYGKLMSVSNDEVDSNDWDPLDVEEEDDSESDTFSDPEGLEDMLNQMGAGSTPDGEPELGDEEYDSPQEVEYRGDFKPELTQLLERLRDQSQAEGSDEQGDQITQEMVEELLESSVEVAQESPEGESRSLTEEFTENMLKEVGLQKPDNPDGGQGPLVHVDEAGGELDPDEPETFVYDEWDFRADDYKPRWCIVRQKNMAEGDGGYYNEILGHYGGLVQQVRRQFELMIPEQMRKERRLQDGEDIDIDDVIEAMVDIRTGASPSEKLYWRRNKIQRDVAVVFLLDTSASTAEAIDDTKRSPDDWDAPDDPVEYMLWLRSRRGEGSKRSYKRIIDLEKEALVLITNALEAVGDTYGIYGFSGYGRENVEFYTIKDIGELFSEKIRRRIDRISPLHATRMGPAIRHATSKLEAEDARTKLLFLISDGRPQDRGYSREGVEKEYAVHDTRMALDEARAKNVNAFCLTVDRNGHDYLKTMTQGMGYEVLDDIYSLPHRLLYLYRKLTM
jgi:hypothetical protein